MAFQLDAPVLDRDTRRVLVPVHVRWADLDPWGHVNNVAMLTLLEEARIAVLWRMGRDFEGETNLLEGGPHANVQSLVVHQEIEYRSQVTYDGRPVRVEMWCSKLTPVQAQVCYEVFGHEDTAPAVLATTTVVPVDVQAGRPTRFPKEIREVWAQVLDERPDFRRR